MGVGSIDFDLSNKFFKCPCSPLSIIQIQATLIQKTMIEIKKWLENAQKNDYTKEMEKKNSHNKRK